VVSADVAAVWALADQVIPAGTELLLNYGGDSFWSPSFVTQEHCAQCFSREGTKDNPLVQCEGLLDDESACLVSRHRYCFRRSEMPSLDELDKPHVRFFCPDHMWQAASTADASPRRPVPTTVFRRAVHLTPPVPLTSYARPEVAREQRVEAGVLPSRQVSAAAALIRADHESRAAPSAPMMPISMPMQFTPPPPLLSFPEVPQPSMSPQARSVVRSILFNSAPPRPAGLLPPVMRQPPISYSFQPATSVSSDEISQSDEGEPGDIYEAAAEQSSDASSSSASWHHDTPDQGSSASEAPSSPDSQERRLDERGTVSAVSSHRVYAAAAQSVGDVMQQAHLIIRKPQHCAAKLGIEYKKHNVPPGEAQVEMIQAALEIYLHRKPRPWFIPKPKATDEVISSDAASAPAQSRAAPALSLRSCLTSRSAPSVIDAASDATLGAAASSWKKGPTRNRWLDVSKFLQHDWAEYKACCGSLQDPINLTTQQIRDHPSGNVVNFFVARLKFHDRVKDAEAFKDRVRDTLAMMDNNRVPIEAAYGGSVCVSCFRAILGCGHDFIFRARKAPDVGERANNPDLTAGGRLRQKRPALKRDRVYHLLFQYSKVHGHHLPNVKGKDLSKTRYFLSIKDLQELAEALSAYEQLVAKSSEPSPVSLHLLKAARSRMEEKDNIHLTLGSSISLMRCSTCDMLDNLVKPAYVALHKRSEAQVRIDTYNKKRHLQSMQGQRAFFNRQKQLAMADPSKLWTITLDGMDQAKTQLPHRARYSKDLDSLPRIKVHAEGGFCFGGRRPIIGLLNLPDLRKDSNLCVMSVEKILDLQWIELENAHAARQELAAMKAARREAAAQADDEVNQVRKDAAAAAPSVSSLDAYPEDGLAREWPQRIHITFDNAAGECKNQWMFRFLGLLVLHGVVQFVTVSTLLVGHTHDIVDQLFSIWARMLRIYDAETYEKMRAIFRERYMSRIEGLVKLMKQRKDATASLAPNDLLTQDQINLVREQQEGASAADWATEAGKILENFTSFVKDTFKDSFFTHELVPHIELQQVSVDVQGWLTRSMERELPALAHLDRPHNFGIEKDEDGKVWLYNKFLVDSTDSTAEGVTHNYPHTATGSYTQRALLYDASAKQTADPYRIPPLWIDTEKMRGTVKKYVSSAAMTMEEAEQFEQMLLRLEVAQQQQRAICAVCSELCAAYCGFGVIHRPKASEDADKKAAQKKSSAKEKAWKAMLAHLYDADFTDAHASQVHKGWWGKWLRRAHEHIQPSYVARGFVLNPELLRVPFHQHPSQLVSNEGQPACMAQPDRVDVSWFHRHGIPRPGDMVIIRNRELREPFHVGVIIDVLGLVDEAKAEVLAVAGGEAAHTAKQLMAAAAAKATAAAESAAAAVVAGSDAAAAAAADGTALPHTIAFKKRRLHKGDLTLKQFKVLVDYWDLHPKDYSGALRLFVEGTVTAKVEQSRIKWWDDLFASNNVKEDELEAEIASAVKENRATPPAPAFIVDLYEKLSFIPRPRTQMKKKKNKKQIVNEEKEEENEENAPAELNGAMLIMWGPREALFKKAKQWGDPSSEKRSWSLRKDAWDALRQDLTEQLHRPEADTDAAALDAMDREDDQVMHEDDAEVEDMEEQKEEEEEEVRPAAAAACAAPALRASTRQRRAATVTQPDFEDAVSEADRKDEHVSEEEYKEPEEEEEERLPSRCKAASKGLRRTHTAEKDASREDKRAPATAAQSVPRTRASRTAARTRTG
jgi:hypothetical protein